MNCNSYLKREPFTLHHRSCISILRELCYSKNKGYFDIMNAEQQPCPLCGKVSSICKRDQRDPAKVFTEHIGCSKRNRKGIGYGRKEIVEIII